MANVSGPSRSRAVPAVVAVMVDEGPVISVVTDGAVNSAAVNPPGNNADRFRATGRDEALHQQGQDAPPRGRGARRQA